MEHAATVTLTEEIALNVYVFAEFNTFGKNKT